MPPALQFLGLTFAGWVNRHQDDLIAYLREENRVLREHLAARGESPVQGSTPLIPRTTLTRMAMGKRRRYARQKTMWVASTDLPQSAGHPFYERLNRVLDDARFDAFVEAQCAKFYTDGVGRPSVAPGRYFRLLLLGYFEGLDSERAIAWRAADSLSIRQFLDLELHEPPPDHSTVSRTRRLIDLETHQAVFTWVLQRLADAQLVKGRTLGIDATTLEANAALRSIVRRDTGEEYDAWLTRLAAASGIATPTRAALARFDRKRKKKGSNDDWTNPHDPDANITKLKDGRTHLAHTAEHAVDLETGAVVGVPCRTPTTATPRRWSRRSSPRPNRSKRSCRPGWHHRGRRRHGVPQQRHDGRVRGPWDPELRLGTGSRAAQLEREGGGTRGGVCQSSADSGHPRATAAAPTR